MGVLVGIEMERAFSALASPVRLPSPLGWAGMISAFGAPPIRRWPHGNTYRAERNCHEQRYAKAVPIGSNCRSHPIGRGTCLASQPRAAGARPSGRFTVLPFPELGKIRNVTGTVPRGSGVNAAVRSRAQ